MGRRYKKPDKTEYLAEISTLSQEGRGIAHLEDKPVFIFGSLPGETINFQYTKKKSQHAEGFTTNVVKASPDRIAPECPHFAICGGCSLQHMSGDYQRNFKLQHILNQLQHNEITPTHVSPTLTGPAWGYRRKARLGVKYVIKKDQVLVGFRERRHIFIADINECLVLDPLIGKKLTAFKDLIFTLDAREHIPQLEIAITDQTTAVIIRNLKPLGDSDIAKIQAFAKAHNLRIYLQPGNSETVHTLDPDDPMHLSYQLPAYNLTFNFLPLQFTQINENINQQMISQALAWLTLKDSDTVLDLFCGIGNFTLPTALTAKSVTGIEGSSSSIEQAKHNATQNNISNTNFHVADLFEGCSELSWAKRSYDKIIIDPPRSGAAAIIALIPKWKPTKILYISCQPATFIRDAATLKDQGYTLEKFSAMDMFPHTKHIEVMGLFSR